MGKRNGPYNAEFPKGSRVRIAKREILENFYREWKFHHPLEAEQLNLAETVAVVCEVGYYHGSDELYRLEGIPGTWHEVCLESAENAG
ncbi:MAG: hypothetical protein ACRESU_02795 [Gammaproteobacteria bacterium]